MSRLRANQITNQSADGAPTVQNGLIVSGVTTSSIEGNVVGNVVGTGVSVVGVITATSFVGSGANLTGLASREFYGFKCVNEDLILIHTNNGADNISKSDFESFEDTMTAPSGLSFSTVSYTHLTLPTRS